MPGDLDSNRNRNVGGDDLIAINTNPHELINQGMWNRIGDTSKTDRHSRRHLAGFSERCGETRVGQAMQPELFLGEHLHRCSAGDPMLTPVDLDHEPGARLNELAPTRVRVEQIGVGRDKIGLRGLNRAFDTTLGLRIGRDARRRDLRLQLRVSPVRWSRCHPDRTVRPVDQVLRPNDGRNHVGDDARLGVKV